VRVVVETLAAEFGVMDVAAAAVKLAHASLDGGGDGDEREVPAVPPARFAQERSGGRDRPGGGERPGSRPPRGRDDSQDVARVFIGAGRQAGVRPGDLVGAITNEAGLTSRDIGAIQIADTFSLVEVPEAVADEVVAAMRKASLRGQKVSVRRDRDTPGSSPRRKGPP
jgi:ATP-dependent RNA helicase DeaD